VIARLGDTLRRRLRSTDVVARLGGDEFAVILRRVEASAALEMVRSVQELVSESLGRVAGLDGEPVTVSAGIASVGGALSADEVLVNADRALYEAKREGRNCAVLHGESQARRAPAPQPDAA
jgi:diguanylate cyclase (GGDEF)-like protein